MTFGSRLRDARVELGLHGYQLADAIGVTSGTLSKWETGKRKRPRGDLVKRLSSALGVRMEWLLTGEEPRSPVAHGAIVTRLLGIAALDSVLVDYDYPDTLSSEKVRAIEAKVYEEAEGAADGSPSYWRRRLRELCAEHADSSTRKTAR